jgi:hypothetical protein
MRADWVEQLSLWLGPLDAITLQAAQQAGRTAPTGRSVGVRRSGVSLEDDLRRVRDGLLHALAQPAGGGKPREGRAGTSPAQADVDFATYRQRYHEQQRRMDLMLEPLRAHCRGVLARASTDLQHLAELDAAMEQTLGEREKALLARLPQALERRFGQRKKEAAEQSHRWHWCFEQDMYQLLLAELAFRLEPIEGLVEAFQNRTMQTQ